MTCSERNNTADFAEQPCRASSGPYWAAPTAAHGPSFDGSTSQALLNQSRGRHPDLTWGLPGIRQEEQQDTDNDSILLLRFLVIIVLAHEGAKQHDLSRPATMLEHPEALRTQFSAHLPHQRRTCSSIWAISWLRNLLHTLGLTLIHFDQCRLGQHTPKPTTVATNLPLLHWQNLRCNHTEHARTKRKIIGRSQSVSMAHDARIGKSPSGIRLCPRTEAMGLRPKPVRQTSDTSTLTKNGPPR